MKTRVWHRNHENSKKGGTTLTNLCKGLRLYHFGSLKALWSYVFITVAWKIWMQNAVQKCTMPHLFIVLFSSGKYIPQKKRENEGLKGNSKFTAGDEFLKKCS